MTVFTETRHPGEFLLSESLGSISRDVVTIESGAGILQPGTVVGQKTIGALTAVGAAGSPAPAGATITASPTTTAGVTKVGVYTLVCETAGATGTWQMYDPEGVYVGTAITGTPAAIDGLGFTISDPGTDPAIGEVLKITVSAAAGSGKWVAAPATANTGAATAKAILLYGVDATSADVKVTAIVRHAEVVGDCLLYAASVDDAGKIAAKVADLAAVDIIVR